MRRKRVFKTARHLADRSDFSPQPHLMHGGGKVSKRRKRLTPGMQEDQVVVALWSESPFSPNPEDARLRACERSCGLRFGEVAIPPFVILHARLGDEQFPVRQRPHYIGQIVMGLVLER